jgi:hypothetical protein
MARSRVLPVLLANFKVMLERDIAPIAKLAQSPTAAVLSVPNRA